MSELPEGYAVVEIMGHKRMAGYIREVEIAGSPFLRVDVNTASSGDLVTQYYSPQSIYCITPATEETVKQLAHMNEPAPVNQWELPHLTSDDDEQEELPYDD